MLRNWIHRSCVGIVELNSPSNRNALSTCLLQSLLDSIQTMEQNPQIRVVIVQAAASSNASALPVFSSGHDLKEILQYQRTKQVDKLQELFALCSKVMTSIANSSKPYVAKVDGVASAAGCQLVATCDLAYATNRSVFVTPGVNIGLFCTTPSVGLSHSGVAKKHMMEMLLTGETITAQKAQEIGLINQAFPSEVELNQHVENIAMKISSKSPEAIKRGKPLVARHISLPLDEAYALASQGMVENALTEECHQGIDAFLSKTLPKWNSREQPP